PTTRRTVIRPDHKKERLHTSMCAAKRWRQKVKLARTSPLLAITARRAVAASSENFRAATETRRSRGGFPFCFYRKTTPASQTADASQYLLIAPPPLLAVMQGGTTREI